MTVREPARRFRPTNRQTVDRLIGAWPDGMAGASARHARTHWDRQRRAVTGRGLPAGGERVVVLAFVGALADDVVSCPRCWRGSAADEQQPQQVIWWALGRRPALRQVVEVMVPQGKRRLDAVASEWRRQTYRPLPQRPRRISDGQAVGA